MKYFYNFVRPPIWNIAKKSQSYQEKNPDDRWSEAWNQSEKKVTEKGAKNHGHKSELSRKKLRRNAVRSREAIEERSELYDIMMESSEPTISQTP